MRNVPGRSALAIAVALVWLLIGASQSFAAFSVQSVSVTPSTTTAGGHPDLTLTTNFSGDADASQSPKSLVVHFGSGLVGNPRAAPTCSQADFAANTCAANTRVGTSTVTATTVGLVPISLPATGSVYNVAPEDPATQAAELGVQVAALGMPLPSVRIPVTISPGDLGLTSTTIDPLTNSSVLGPIRITQMVMTLNAAAANGPFMTNPTACIPVQTTVTATAYDGTTDARHDTYTPTDCATEPFDTGLTVSADPATNDSPSAITVDVKVGAADTPRINSNVRETTVVLPPGVLINSALAARLDACTDAQFAQSNTGVQAACPASSNVGQISFKSPLFDRPFPGTAYFGTSTPTDLLRLFLDVPLFGAHIKISAHVRPDPNTGQITTIFDALPQIAFTDFQLTFRGGQQSALVTPTTCGANTATAVLSPWSGGAPATPSGSFTTSGDGRGAPCSRTFSPSIAASVGSTKAGVSTPFTLKVTRPDRTVPFRSMKISLPPGLIGKIALPGLTQCSLAQAAAASCPASSRVGSVTSVVGSGSEPPSLPGTVYLAAPKAAGDPASLAIVVPAKLGPVDTGTIVVGARLTLRGDGGLDVLSDAIPALQRGIPLAIQQLTITLDKPGFMQNPSSCGPQTITGSFAALDGGPGASASTQLTTTDCGAVPFAPQISASVTGTGLTKPGAHPTLTTLIQQKVGEGAIRTAKVTLPRTLSTNVAALLAGCSPAKLAANACPRSSQVATATAISPLIAQPLSGPVYLIVERGRVPRLRVQLRGPVAVDLNGITSFARGGGLITTFDNIPDLALTRFQLVFHGGRLGVMAVVSNLCSPTPKISATFTGHSGRVTNQSHAIAVTGCPPAASASMRFRGSSGTLSAKVARQTTGKPLAAVSIALPRGLSFTRSGIVAKVGTKSLASRAISVKGRVISLNLGRTGASGVTLTVRKVTASSKALARRLATKKARLSLTVGTRDTAKHRTKGTIALRLR